jgi:hypothetical protein
MTTGPSSSGSPSSSTTSLAPAATQTIPILSATTGAGSATSVPSSSNPLVQTYGDALQRGKPANYGTNFGPLKQTTGTFGKGVYSTTAGAVPTSSSTITNPANGFTTYQVYRNPPYSTGLSSDLPMVVHPAPALQAEMRSIINRSSFVRNPAGVQVSARDGVVQLTGQVANEKERWLIEGMVRTAPGVIGVVNELKVGP